MSSFPTKKAAEASQARALLVAAKKHKAMKSALEILGHLHDYVATRDLNDGKYVERAVYTAMCKLRDDL